MHLWPRPAVMSQSYITTAGEKFSDCRSTNSRLSGGATAFYSLTRPLVCGLGNRPIWHKPGWSEVTSVTRTWAGCLRLQPEEKRQKLINLDTTLDGPQQPTPNLGDQTWPDTISNFVGLNLGWSDLASTAAQSGLVFCRAAERQHEVFLSSPSGLRGTLANIPRSVSDGLWCQRVLQPRQNILVYFRHCWSKNWQNLSLKCEQDVSNVWFVKFLYS